MTRVEDLEKIETEAAEPETKLTGVVKIIEVIGTSRSASTTP
ncbi:MAG: hypothetical protein AABM32_03300 [Chloroflexota bacterium]